MPQAKQIVLNNDTTDINFNPNNIDRNGVAHFLSAGDGQLDLSHHLSLGVTRSSGSKTAKATMKIEVIKPQTVDGLMVPSGKAIFEAEIKFPSHFTTEDRAGAYALIKSAFANSDVADVMSELQSIY